MRILLVLISLMFSFNTYSSEDHCPPEPWPKTYTDEDGNIFPYTCYLDIDSPQHRCSEHNTQTNIYLGVYSAIPRFTDSQGCGYITITNPAPPGFKSPCYDYELIPSFNYSGGPATQGDFVPCERDPYYCPDDQRYNSTLEKCCTETSCLNDFDSLCASLDIPVTKLASAHPYYSNFPSLGAEQGCMLEILSKELEPNAEPVDGSGVDCYTFTRRKTGDSFKRAISEKNLGSWVYRFRSCEMIDTCPDGFPPNTPPYTTCDRPALKQCGDSHIPETELCLDPGGGSGGGETPGIESLAEILERINENITDSTVLLNNSIIDSDTDIVSEVGDLNEKTREGHIAIETAVNQASGETRKGHIALETGISRTNTLLDSGLSDIVGGLTDIKGAIENQGDKPVNMGAHTENEHDSVSSVNDAFYDRLGKSPLVSSMSSVKNIIRDGGSCVAFSIDLTEQGLGFPSTDIHCTVAEMIRPIISSVMIVVYLLVAFRVFASA